MPQDVIYAEHENGTMYLSIHEMRNDRSDHIGNIYDKSASLQIYQDFQQQYLMM